jgi:nucleoside-diphosphate-sugar epimerase
MSAALQGVDGSVHLAAIVGDPACARQPDEARDINLEATRALFADAYDRGVERFVFTST